MKLSGESLCRDGATGIEPGAVLDIAREIKRAADTGAQIAIVIGGGNICRGAALSQLGVDRNTSDRMGMLATIINSLALADALEKLGTCAKVMASMEMADVADTFSARKCVKHLEKGCICLIAGGTGNPFFSTDTAAVLRAREIGADALLKATKVDGVYDRDPMKDKKAKKFTTITAKEALDRGLKVMDLTAFALAMDGKLPIVVFNLRKPGNIRRAVSGEQIGTVVS